MRLSSNKHGVITGSDHSAMRGRVPYACGGHAPDKYRGRPQDDGIGGTGTGGQVSHSRCRHPANKYGGCARWQDWAAHVWHYTRDQWAGVHIRYSCSWFTHLINHYGGSLYGGDGGTG